MTGKMLMALRRDREERFKRRMRELYPRDIAGDIAAQLPPPKGSRRPQFSRPLRHFTTPRKRAGQTKHTGWGFA